MTIVKRFVLHGPRPPGTASNAPISHGERQQAEPPTSILKKPSDKPEIELAQSPGNPKKRKRVRFESPPGEPTGTREGFSEFQRLRAAEANAAATRTSGPQLTIGSMQRIQSHSDDGNIVAVERESPADQVSDDKSDDGSPLSDLEQLGSQLNTQSHSSTANRPWARKGKEPAKAAILVRDEDVEMSDAEETEEEVDEGDIDYNEHITSDEEIDDLESVISLSSTEDAMERDSAGACGIPDRPWKSPEFTRDMRRQWELMYVTVTQDRVGSAWEHTEEYQHEKDKEMLRYIEDFPLALWVIPKEQAEEAHSHLQQRIRWRNLGITIYGQQRVPEMIPNPTPYSYAVPPNQGQSRPGPTGVHQNAYPPQHANGRLPSAAQQQGPYQYPPNIPPPPPPAQQTLRSQPHAPSPGSVGHYAHYYGQVPGPFMGPVPPSMPYTVAYTNPPGVASHSGYPVPHQHQPAPGTHSGKRKYKPRKKAAPPSQPLALEMHSGGGTYNVRKETPSMSSPPLPPSTPPYEQRERPADKIRITKAGKRNLRRMAEPEEYPWHRNIDFRKAREEADWDDSGYDQAVLDSMAATREQNRPYVQEQDDNLSEKQRRSRHSRRKGISQMPLDTRGAESDDEDGELKKDFVDPTKKRTEHMGGDSYYSGNFCFYSQTDQQKALVLQRSAPDQILDAAEAGDIDWDICKEIYVTWNASKKGQTEQLTQAKFRLYDTLITRQQLRSRPILTRRAAECITDFCPDMLWRETLLRMASEAGYGNKDVRDRFCYNGCWADKATFTKRIAAALGQKQNNSYKPKKDVGAEDEEAVSKQNSKRYGEGELEWYEQNDRDYNNYIAYFGKRSGYRNLSNVLRADKKKWVDGPEEGSSEAGPASNRGKSEVAETRTTASQVVEGGEMDVEGSEEKGEEENDDKDAVSEQDSDILDEMSD